MTVREMLQRQRASRTHTKPTSPEPREQHAPLFPNSGPPPSVGLPLPDLRTPQEPFPQPLLRGQCCDQNMNVYEDTFHHHHQHHHQNHQNHHHHHPLVDVTDSSSPLLQHLYQPQTHSYHPSGLGLTHGQSSDVDYYGPALTSSPVDPLKMCSPEHYSSCSPHDSFSSSSSSSSCYDSPRRLEPAVCPEPYLYPPQAWAPDSYTGPLWTGADEPCGPEYGPHCGSSDWTWGWSEEGVHRRDLSNHICFNAL